MFTELSLHERLLKALAELSFEKPTPVQAAAIPPAIAGEDLYIIAQTGSGKTAAYVLPILQRLLEDDSKALAPRALVLSPTRELAQQILKDVQALARFTFLKAELVIGGEDFKVQAAKLRKNPDIVIATPGRTLEQLEAGGLDLSEVQTLVIDEADRMLDMGFSEDVLSIASACPEQRQTMLFSATTGNQGIRRMVEQILNEPRWLELDSVKSDTPAIRQQVIPVDDNTHREKLTRWLLLNECEGKAIVFTNTRVMADRLNGVLRAVEGLRVYVLHGEKDQKERKLAIERFKQGGKGVLVATDVAARGLDISELDLVINFDMPRSGDDYLHRVGRTGRAGAEGLAVSLVAPHEWSLMSSIERYLRRQFERREIKELAGSFKGPKKVKASGKPVGAKKKKDDKKKVKRPKTAKPAARRKPAIPKGQVVLDGGDGLAPPKRRS
ncbi:MAG: DEAD/DEAH box helicase [Pseudomonadaceae bacterium]|uniref:Superfamily II DNA and RNA helicase n=1 Tax=Halopseudomonas formosensis TaxID=1002526 RepID=A0A1I6AM84_9GAMM|nr:DEAD/DEAH box helicase [Halopseudomonas formosensis]MDY3198051.1 DEAD/DEAH box helicase [Pseudomonadaceae bacterium]SFQ69749.1 Superfamily II DNA and RNA helicase [Halopseudomonas formosensis]